MKEVTQKVWNVFSTFLYCIVEYFVFCTLTKTGLNMTIVFQFWVYLKRVEI